MAFYKLFYLIHHRTDWIELYRWERKIMMPEWYREQERLAQLAVKRLKLLSLGLRGVLDKTGYFLE